MPPARDRSDRIRQDVTDISSVEQLLRYATAGQLEQVLERRTGLAQGKIAQAAGLGANPRTAGPVLAVALRTGPTAVQLRGLDEIIGVLAPDLDGTTSLSSLALRLSADPRGKVRETSLAARVPSRWATKILTDPPDGDIGVLIQASALISQFLGADKIGTADIITSVRGRFSDEIELLGRRLMLLSAVPPAARDYDAQILFGLLASYAFEPMSDRLESQLRHSPLAFRMWPAITKLVTLSHGGDHVDALRALVRRLMRDSEELRTQSLYAAPGLDVELAISVPAAWSPPGDDWAREALLTRARNVEATLQERGTAAMGLWQRAMDTPDAKKTEEDLRELINGFRNPDVRPDAAAGFRWVAATLEHVIDNRIAVCNDWPDVDERWFRNVQEAADEIDRSAIPAHLRTGTKNLFRHMILQNAGVYRRQAVETVAASGWTEPVARALGSLLRAEKDEPWLRARAQFALGLLQRPDAMVEADLTKACLEAYKNLKLDETPEEIPPRSRVSEMQASLFAVSDCFGVAGAEDRARTARDRLRPILEDLTDMTEDPRALILRRAARAAAYLLGVTAQPGIGSMKDFSQEMLEKLANHPDPVTAKLSRWMLSFRFATDGTIRPLLASAEYGEPDDRPY
jgi:hypothetical protein